MFTQGHQKRCSKANTGCRTGCCARILSARSMPQSQDPAATRLTPKEVETLRLLAKGDTNKPIARQLNVSPHTVKVHTSNLFRKIKHPVQQRNGLRMPIAVRQMRASRPAGPVLSVSPEGRPSGARARRARRPPAFFLQRHRRAAVPSSAPAAPDGLGKLLVRDAADAHGHADLFRELERERHVLVRELERERRRLVAAGKVEVGQAIEGALASRGALAQRAKQRERLDARPSPRG